MKYSKKKVNKVQEQILANLPKDAPPWKKTWDKDPVNFYSGNPYHGVNCYTLGLASVKQNVRNVWVTHLQAEHAGNPITHAAKGKGITIVHSNWFEDPLTLTQKWHGLSYWTVFSVDYQLTPPPIAITDAMKPIPKNAQEIIDHMPMRPDIRTSDGRAYYSPFFDFINVPEAEYFDTAEDWVTTMFHELAHSTGAKKRCNRFGPEYQMPSREDYAQEELIAEFAAAFLCAACDLTQTFDNSTAYIKNWKQAIKANPNCLTEGIRLGQQAALFIMGPDAQDEDLSEEQEN